MARRKKKRRSKTPPQVRLCDPAMCDCCQYIGEGDFLCDKHMAIVVSDWAPTDDYLICRREDS